MNTSWFEYSEGLCSGMAQDAFLQATLLWASREIVLFDYLLFG